MSEHTPTPWKVGTYRYDRGNIMGQHPIIMRHDSNDPYIPIAQIQVRAPIDFKGITKAMVISEAKANAEFIVRACNSHAALVEFAENIEACRFVPDYVHEWAVNVLEVAKS